MNNPTADEIATMQENRLDFETILNFWLLGDKVVEQAVGNVTRRVRVELNGVTLIIIYSNNSHPLKILSISVYAGYSYILRNSIYTSTNHKSAMLKIQELINVSNNDKS